LAEARNSDRDAIGVIAGPLDVVGRVARSGVEAVEHGEQPVETDGGTIEGSKIECSHGITSKLSEMRKVRPQGPDRLLCASPWGLRSPDVGTGFTACKGRTKGLKREGDRPISAVSTSPKGH